LSHLPTNRTEIIGLLRRIPVHTFFLTAYPIVSLLAFNIDQILARDAFKFLLISLSITAMLLLGSRLFCKNLQLAGILTSLLVIWFFNYGRIYAPLKSVSILGLVVGRHRYLLVSWSTIFIAAALWARKRVQLLPELTTILNIFSGILICMPIFQIGTYYLRSLPVSITPTASTTAPLISWTDNATPPDIYYIVLDAYTRSDVLEDEFGIDNSAFLGDLQQMGFYIAECAQSNYTRTRLSLTSTFNMDYIQTLKPGIAPDEDPSVLMPYLKHNLVRQQLEQLGYKTIVFKHSWERFVWDDASIVYKSSGAGLLSPFEYLLLRMTIIRAYLDLRIAENLQLTDYTNYEDTVYALEQLSKVPDIPGSKFVFAHLIIPHQPFVFGPNGEKIDLPYDADAGNIYSEEDYKLGYTWAVNYINKRMLEIIPQLLQDSETPPIIIIAGDHGTPWGGSENAVKILNALFTPGSQARFYNSITPVNTFRVLFNTYFNSNFDLLPDKSFLFDQGGYFDFKEIPVVCNEMN
jgi:hypothetical protein